MNVVGTVVDHEYVSVSVAVAELISEEGVGPPGRALDSKEMVCVGHSSVSEAVVLPKSYPPVVDVVFVGGG